MDFGLKLTRISYLDDAIQHNGLMSAEIRKANQAEGGWFLVIHSRDGTAYVLAGEVGIVTYDDLLELEEVIANLPFG
ncbi:MAG: hypothetical protein JKY93_12255 [Gammaproteobacteria bacterium]|nr:hypothetical protein [Gammaproteobacteria bacterium]